MAISKKSMKVSYAALSPRDPKLGPPWGVEVRRAEAHFQIFSARRAHQSSAAYDTITPRMRGKETFV